MKRVHTPGRSRPHRLLCVLLCIASLLVLVHGQTETTTTPTSTTASTDTTTTTTKPATTTATTSTTTATTTTTTSPTSTTLRTTTTSPTTTTAATSTTATTTTTTTATTTTTTVDSSTVAVDSKSEYGTKTPSSSSGSGSSNSTSSSTSSSSSVGSWLVPVIIAVVVVGALVFVSFMKKPERDENERDAGGHRRATSYFEHPRTNKSHLSAKSNPPQDDYSADQMPVLGNSQSGVAISMNGNDQPMLTTPPPAAPMMMKKHSSTLTASTNGASPHDRDRGRSSAKSDDVSVMLESFPRVLSSPQSTGSSFKTPEPGTSVIL